MEVVEDISGSTILRVVVRKNMNLLIVKTALAYVKKGRLDFLILSR
jgi:hypothetical protein